ncbi:Synaptotagmin-6 Synaptotagmin VI [Collichthys lucidus]|uniref:Synaptotagmin-6 Synaptotagmin VI n=1 Tax=Collichthys lucidus TaxID=240159 RepID=A0A4U5UPK6_COLLU|nr:Synaptotagmin-6 Synaptotagmin VI [Collichthys lucidus]
MQCVLNHLLDRECQVQQGYICSVENKPHIAKEDLYQDLTKEQADYCLSPQEPQAAAFKERLKRSHVGVLFDEKIDATLLFYLRNMKTMKLMETDATSGLLLGVFVVCGLALFGLLTFVSWKLCCVPWRTKAHFPSPSLSPACGPEHRPLQSPPLLPSPQQPPVTMATEKVKDPMGSMGFLEAAVKISHTSPDIPTDVQLSMREHFLRRTQRMQRQTTEPTSSTRLVTYMCMWVCN